MLNEMIKLALCLARKKFALIIVLNILLAYIMLYFTYYDIYEYNDMW